MSERKQVIILRGSPRKQGNTNWLTDIVAASMEKAGCFVRSFDLYDMTILPCLACRNCQKDRTAPRCIRNDDMQTIFREVLTSDLILLASPVYSWYCTPPVKAALDRMVYAMNKFYGAEKGPALWAGKSLALITTCGYRPEKGADLFEEGMKRYCKHSSLVYRGMLCERHLGYQIPFPDEEKQAHAAVFADALLREPVI